MKRVGLPWAGRPGAIAPPIDFIHIHQLPALGHSAAQKEINFFFPFRSIPQSISCSLPLFFISFQFIQKERAAQARADCSIHFVLLSFNWFILVLLVWFSSLGGAIGRWRPITHPFINKPNTRKQSISFQPNSFIHQINKSESWFDWIEWFGLAGSLLLCVGPSIKEERVIGLGPGKQRKEAKEMNEID